MMTTVNSYEASGYLTFIRSSEDLAQFHVTGGKFSRKEISTFLGKLPHEPYKEYILLDYDLQSDGVNWEWSFYTTNEEAIAIKQMENPGQEITRVRITGFILNPFSNGFHCSGDWNDYRLYIYFSKDWEDMEIDFYKKTAK
jgi:hypothetical protein